MSSTDPKDPNAPADPRAGTSRGERSGEDPNAAVAAAEAALAQAKAAASAAEAARARAVNLAKSGQPASEGGNPDLGRTPPPPVPGGGKHGRGGGGRKPLPVSDPLTSFAATGGEERPMIGKGGRMRMSRVAIATAIAVLLVAAAGFVWVLTDQDAKARMDAAFDGNICGEAGTQSCLTLLVTAEKRSLETKWRENILRQKPIYGSLSFSYEPNDATIEMYQVRFRISPEEWKSGAKDLLGTKVCDTGTKGPDGKDTCEVAYKAWENNVTGQCVEGQVPTEMPPITGKPLVSLDHSFVPLFETKVDCTTGEVTEAFNYEYRVVIQHKDFDPKTVYISRSAWTPGLGAHTLEFPPLALVPKPETMLDELVKFRSELFCYMKKKALAADKVPSSVVDALRTQNGFVTIELYDRTEALLPTPAHKPWWDERLKEIEAQKCEE